MDSEARKPTLATRLLGNASSTHAYAAHGSSQPQDTHRSTIFNPRTKRSGSPFRGVLAPVVVGATPFGAQLYTGSAASRLNLPFYPCSHTSFRLAARAEGNCHPEWRLAATAW